MFIKLKLILVLSIFSFVSLYAQTADEIINKALQAQGNEYMKKFKTLKMQGKITGFDKDIPFKIYYKFPKSVRSEMTMDKKTMIQAFDGKEGWYIAPDQTKAQKMPADQLEQLKQQANVLESPFTDYKKKGITVTLKGKKKVDGKDAYQLKLTQKGQKQTMYVFIDAKTYIFFKTQIEGKKDGKKLVFETFMKNHKNISGAMIPHLVENKANGKLVSKMILDYVEANAKLDDSMFKMPK
ncbi:MAG: hypothetical protein WCT77_07960 [Bacteroidota bacterium]